MYTLSNGIRSRRSAEFAPRARERDGAFGAYIARPKALPAPAVVVLQKLFGVNADIRKTCDEIAEQGFVAVAPDLFWRQEPGVDLGVTSEADWQHGLLANRLEVPILLGL